MAIRQVGRPSHSQVRFREACVSISIHPRTDLNPPMSERFL